MSTHNIYFRGEIRKILCAYPLLSVAMLLVVSRTQWVKTVMLHHAQLCFPLIFFQYFISGRCKSIFGVFDCHLKF